MNSKSIKRMVREIPFYTIGWTLRRGVFVVIGAVIAALGYAVFQVPYNLAAGGVSGIGIIINHFTGWPVGTMFLIMNIPLLILGFYYLGRWKFLGYTIVAVITFSAASDGFVYWLPTVMEEYPVTNDMLLSAIYAGIIFGIGSGIIFRMDGTIGGTNVTGRIIQMKTGLPLSQIYIYTDGAIIFIAGLIFGWESALHAMMTLFFAGIATDFVIEGPSFIRTITIVTDHPTDVAKALMYGLKRGASEWSVTGSYTGKSHSMVFCTIYRSQVNELKQLIATVDENAFVVIGKGHQALGLGFMRLGRNGRTT